MRKIKSDYKNRARISSDILMDARGAKETFILLAPSSNFVKGFIQEINFDPYGIIFFSSMQVRSFFRCQFLDLIHSSVLFLFSKVELWKKIQTIASSTLVWHFDATGTIHAKIKGQKKPFYYAIVLHHQKLLIPLFEFVTTQNDEYSIASYLFKFKTILGCEKMFKFILLIKKFLNKFYFK